MRIAILSDIHGNLEALEATLAAIDRLGTDLIHSLGDLVGYGPDPAACIALVRERAALSLLGNHDAAVAGLMSPEDFNEFARWAVEWTASRLRPEDLSYLARLPYAERQGEIFLVHASPGRPEAWEYIHGLADVADHFAEYTGKICFVGHSHRPGIYARSGDGLLARYRDRATLRPDQRGLVNAGSVGQPRDRNPLASFALYDTESGEVSLHRVAYPVQRTQRRMREEGMPAFLVDRLEAGV